MSTGRDFERFVTLISREIIEYFMEDDGFQAFSFSYASMRQSLLYCLKEEPFRERFIDEILENDTSDIDHVVELEEESAYSFDNNLVDDFKNRFSKFLAQEFAEYLENQLKRQNKKY